MFNKTLPQKEEFYSNLNIEDITDAGYMDAKRFCKNVAIKHLGDCFDLYFKTDTLRLLDVFKNFRKRCFWEIYHLDLVKFISSTGLSWLAVLEKTEVKLGIID